MFLKRLLGQRVSKMTPYCARKESDLSKASCAPKKRTLEKSSSIAALSKTSGKLVMYRHACQAMETWTSVPLIFFLSFVRAARTVSCESRLRQ